jgi:hypothetical protein
MLRLTKKIIFTSLLLVLAFSCKKSNDLTTLSDFLSRDDSDSKILREYKTWEMAEATLVREGLPTLVYKKGQPIQSNFDPSKISFVFSSNKTFQGTDEKGKPESGTWVIDETAKQLKISNSTTADLYDILQLTKTNFDFKADETYEQKLAVVTLKMIPKK